MLRSSALFEKSVFDFHLGSGLQIFEKLTQDSLARFGLSLFYQCGFVFFELAHVRWLTTFERQNVNGIFLSIEPFRNGLLRRKADRAAFQLGEFADLGQLLGAAREPTGFFNFQIAGLSQFGNVFFLFYLFEQTIPLFQRKLIRFGFSQIFFDLIAHGLEGRSRRFFALLETDQIISVLPFDHRAHILGRERKRVLVEFLILADFRKGFTCGEPVADGDFDAGFLCQLARLCACDRFLAIAVSDFRGFPFCLFAPENLRDLRSRFLERFSLLWLEIFGFENLKSCGRFDRIAHCSLAKTENGLFNRRWELPWRDPAQISALRRCRVLRKALRQVGKVFARSRFFNNALGSSLRSFFLAGFCPGVQLYRDVTDLDLFRVMKFLLPIGLVVVFDLFIADLPRGLETLVWI